MNDDKRAWQVWEEYKRQLCKIPYPGVENQRRIMIRLIAAYGKQERERALEEAAERMLTWDGDWNAQKLAFAIRALKERKP